MNNTISNAQTLIRKIKELMADTAVASDAEVEVMVAPPFTALPAVRREIGDAAISLAAQNVSYADSGAHTAEVSAEMLVDIGVRYAIVGHSERRHIYHEDDTMVAARAAQAIDNEIVPIVCVGETLEEREAGRHLSVCKRQLSVALERIPSQRTDGVLIAYEPVWAIGTGKTASPQDAQQMHHHLRASLAEMSNQQTADAVSILYGGSVKPENSKDLLSQPDIDGALIGGASLVADSFIKIMESAL